jgi:cysteinyl-tRNA synthetase
MHEFVEDIMGILLDGSENQTALSTALKGTVSMLIDIRKAARDNKDFAASDRIRDELLALGVQLKDGKDGTEFSL